MIAPSAVIYPNVTLGKNVVIEEFCLIGVPCKGADGISTTIGDDSVIRSHTVIYAGNSIGRNFQTGHKANIRELNEIGNDVSIGTHSVIEHHVTIQDGVRIHTQVFVPEFSTLCKNSWLGPNVVLTNAKFPRSPNVKNELAGPRVGENAKIGANSTILPGVIVHENALVGAGSVVTHDVPKDTIVAGNPARILRQVHY